MASWSFDDLVRHRWTLSGGGLAAAFALGVLAAVIGQPGTAVAPISGRSVYDLPRPGAANSAIVERLRPLIAPSTVAKDIDDTTDPGADDDPLANVDVETALRADITAIVHREGDDGEAIWIVDRENVAPGARKRLTTGDIYVAEWRIAAIREQQVTLTRQDETITVQFYGVSSSTPPDGNSAGDQ
ncbi:MAG: hypothetical protein AAGA09_09645 [Pseudomonadota bacterium]